MASTNKPNMGALWSNKYKGPHDKRPDYTGEIDVAGVTYKIAAWEQNNFNKHKPHLVVKVSEPYIAKTAMDPIKTAVAVPVSAMPHDIEDPFGWGGDNIPF